MLTELQIENMTHALGMNQKKKHYRNYFAAYKGGEDFESWGMLVAKGYATMRLNIPSNNDIAYFHVTDEGIEALKNAI